MRLVATRLAEISRLQSDAAGRGAWSEVAHLDRLRWRLLEELIVRVSAGEYDGVVDALQQARIWSEVCAMKVERALAEEDEAAVPAPAVARPRPGLSAGAPTRR